MDSADESGDVNVQDVPILNHRGIGDAVADNFIEGRAEGLREAPVAQRGGVGIVVHKELMANLVQLVRRHAGLDVLANFNDGTGGDPAGDTDLLDGLR